MACWRQARPREDRLRLVHRLAVLEVGLGVRDRAAARLDVGDAVLDDDGADVDRGVEVAVEAEVADRAAVGAALVGLELVDDLHRAHLRRARERARRKAGAEGVHGADVGAERPRDAAHDVEDVRVGLDDHELLDLDRAVLADAAQVVSPQVDEHHVLGALLGIGEKVLGVAAVLLLVGAARVGARDRPRLDAARRTP